MLLLRPESTRLPETEFPTISDTYWFNYDGAEDANVYDTIADLTIPTYPTLPAK
jgi:hypothetical protein